jgi:hypothetical protein
VNLEFIFVEMDCESFFDMGRDVILRLTCYVDIASLRSLIAMCLEVYRWRTHPYFHDFPIAISSGVAKVVYDRVSYGWDMSWNLRCYHYQKIRIAG